MIPAHKQRRLNRTSYFSSKENLWKLIKAAISNRKAACVHCQSPRIVRHGQYRGRQRYKCQHCRRTFNDLTNTPLHRTKHMQKWLLFLECMVYGYSLRRTAIRVGVSFVTIFYWRHKVIKALQVVDNEHRLDPFWPKRSYPYICVGQNPPLYAVWPEERETFKKWICTYGWIARKYLKRYISWFRHVQKSEALFFMEKRMMEMLSMASSVPLEQTYENVRLAS